MGATPLQVAAARGAAVAYRNMEQPPVIEEGNVRLNRFNDLPPKPEYLQRVRLAMRKQPVASAVTLVTITGLTRTQVLCALEELLKLGEVVREPGPKLTFRLDSDGSKPDS